MGLGLGLMVGLLPGQMGRPSQLQGSARPRVGECLHCFMPACLESVPVSGHPQMIPFERAPVTCTRADPQLSLNLLCAMQGMRPLPGSPLSQKQQGWHPVSARPKQTQRAWRGALEAAVALALVGVLLRTGSRLMGGGMPG